MISTVEKVLFLKSVSLFTQIPGEVLVRVAQIAEQVDFRPKEALMSEGEIGDSMYIIVDGKVGVYKGTRLYTELGEREVVGEMAVLDSEPRSATVRALTAVSALKIERQDLYDLMHEKLEIAHGIIKVLIRRLRNSTGASSGA
ncbi:cyclic nucleotide-binding domain-containing protein [Myxococcota bacterium]|nr:cyclic nucleotide-binding domain-containing protein [Myxococcota bacterium]